MPDHIRLRRAAALVAAVAVPTAVAVTAHEAAAAFQATATTRTINVENDYYSPKTLTAAQGDTIRWAFVGGHTHTATDATGMKLFDSGFKSSGTYDKTLTAAGAYPFRCNVHWGMSGTVKVALKAAPATGTAATSFQVTWSSAAAATGFAYDVQVKRPGTTGFVAWKTGVTTVAAAFRPDAGTGTYQFRSRLRKLADGTASGWSPARSITVS